MAWIVAVQYGLTALAALFGITSVLRLRTELKSPSDRGARLLDRFMIFSVLLLVLSGLLAVYDGYFLRQNSWESEMAPIIARMDQIVGEKLDTANDAFAPMDLLSKQFLDNIMRQLCRDVVDLAKMAAAPARSCGARLQRPPFDGPA